MENLFGVTWQMKNKINLVIAKCAIAILLLAGIFLLLPRTKNCCDKFDPHLEKLNDRAYAGEIDAIRTLYNSAKRDGVKPMEELWAMRGALAGDAGLRTAYIEIFRTRIDIERQNRLLSSFREQISMPGAPCLLQSLDKSSANVDGC